MSHHGDLTVMIVCGFSLLAVMTVVHAQALSDPTRPPTSVDRPAAGESGEAAPAAGLQTIIRGRKTKPAAVINGEYVELGGRIGDARVIKIGEDSVTLKSATGQETLKLTPDIEKTPVKKDGEKIPKKVTGDKHRGAEATK